jgi:signal transduction histidine kinase
MPGGGPVELGLAIDGGRARITVADRGGGFDERQRRGAFTPFWTTKETGSGLGLAMAKRIVEGHGGRIELANREGGGAIVTVTLPRGEES